MPQESPSLSGRVDGLHHHPGQEVDLSSIPIGVKTQKKSQNLINTQKMSQNVEDYSSPGKKGMFKTGIYYSRCTGFFPEVDFSGTN